MRLLHGYLGRAFLQQGKSWTSFPLSQQTYKRIKCDQKVANHTSNGAATLTPAEDLRIGLLGSKTVRLATCQFILVLGMWCAGRGLDPIKTLNKHITFEKERTVRGFLRPRVSHNFLTDKTHRIADAVKRSDAQTLEKSVECGCPDSENHSQDNRICQISGVVAFFEFKDAVWTRFHQEQRNKGLDDKTIRKN